MKEPKQPAFAVGDEVWFVMRSDNDAVGIGRITNVRPVGNPATGLPFTFEYMVETYDYGPFNVWEDRLQYHFSATFEAIVTRLIHI